MYPLSSVTALAPERPAASEVTGVQLLVPELYLYALALRPTVLSPPKLYIIPPDTATAWSSTTMGYAAWALHTPGAHAALTVEPENGRPPSNNAHAVSAAHAITNNNCR